MGWDTLPWSTRQAIIVGLTHRGYLTYQRNIERSLAATLQPH